MMEDDWEFGTTMASLRLAPDDVILPPLWPISCGPSVRVCPGLPFCPATGLGQRSRPR